MAAAADDLADLDVDGLKRRLNGRKIAYGRFANTTRRLVELTEDTGHHRNADYLEEEVAKLREAATAIDRIYAALLDATRNIPADQEMVERGQRTFHTEYDDLRIRCQAAIADARAPPEEAAAAANAAVAQAAAAAAAGQQNNGVQLVNDAIRPKTLTLDFSPAELNEWIDEYRTFYDTSSMHRFNLSSQQVYLTSTMDQTLKVLVKAAINNETPIFGDGGCMATLKRLFLEKYPLFRRRNDWFKCAQKPHESTQDWDARLTKLGNEADLHTMTVEDLYMFKYMLHHKDERTRQKFLEVENPTRERLLLLASRKDNAKETAAATKDSPGSAHAGQARGRSMSKTPSSARPRSESRSNGPCYACGGKHTRPNCQVDKRKLKCGRCNKKGHVQSVCGLSKKSSNNNDNQHQRQRSQSRGRNDTRRRSPSPSPSRGSAKVAKCCTARATPTFRCHFRTMRRHTKEGDYLRFSADVCPDTGCTYTLFNKDVLRMYGVLDQVDMDKPENLPSILNASDNVITLCGRIQLLASYQGKETVIDALVSEETTEEILFSCKDLKGLGIIHKDFPNRCNAVKYNTEASHTDQKCQELKAMLLEDYSDVFRDDLGERRLEGEPMTIHLSETREIQPKVTYTARPVAKHYQKAAEELIAQLLRDGIIAKVNQATDWVSPAHFVPKKNGGVRLVTDYTRLNQYVKRPIHPFPCTVDIPADMDPEAKVFARTDAVHGYFQVPLEDDSSYLTTFLLPSGRYRYLVAPMGLNASGDEWCNRSDEAYRGHVGTQKLVDDGLTMAKDVIMLRVRLEALLDSCREKNITLSRKKFEIGSEVKFAGHVITGEGIKPDPEKIKALSEFPTPHNVKTVRSFIGLANQLGQFMPDLSHVLKPMRELIRKDSYFVWTPAHQLAFQKAKEILTCDQIVKPFDPSLPIELYTDASRLHGLGYMLLQREKDGKHRLVRCGSRSLLPAETRYATIELELLAIVYAVQQCGFYLIGAQFKIFTDHNPLVGIFRKELRDISNVRLMRFREKLLHYNFSVVWVKGKTNEMADALSRAPVFHSSHGSEDDDAEEELLHCLRMQLRPEQHSLQDIREAMDKDYNRLVKAVRTNMSQHVFKRVLKHNAYYAVNKHWDRISILGDDLLVLDGVRIIVPTAARSKVLKSLHLAHQGEKKTQAMAAELYFWPGYSNDIRNMVKNCDECQKLQASQPREPIEQEGQLTCYSFPMCEVGVDLFQHQGHHYLVMVDRYSGYPFCSKLTKLDTEAIIKTMLAWFYDHGYPMVIRADGGPQFREKFLNFCTDNGITLETSSPYNPESNGLAESAVKQMKYLVAKCKAKKEDFRKALLAWRNTPSNGVTPAMLFSGHRQRTNLPAVSEVYKCINDKERERQEKAKQHTTSTRVTSRNKSTVPLIKLDIGQLVYVQNPTTKKWDTKANVISQRSSGRSYQVEDCKTGKIRLLNRHFLRPCRTSVEDETDADSTDSSWSDSSVDEDLKECLRKSVRFRLPKKEVIVQTANEDGGTSWASIVRGQDNQPTTSSPTTTPSSTRAPQVGSISWSSTSPRWGERDSWSSGSSACSSSYDASTSSTNAANNESCSKASGTKPKEAVILAHNSGKSSEPSVNSDNTKISCEIRNDWQTVTYKRRNRSSSCNRSNASMSSTPPAPQQVHKD